MASESEQVRALQQAILERAGELSGEHIAQGEMTRNKIIADAREKIKLMEQKELLAARVNADREYQRQVQASELRIQAELDRNRWGLVQSVLDKLSRRLVALHKDDEAYRPVFEYLLRDGVERLGRAPLVASLSNEDLKRFHDDWQTLVETCCGDQAEVRLSPEACLCSGGLRLVSEQGDVMIDNTFEGIISRRENELQQLIFERLFSTVSSKGTVFDG
ncbi:MAG: V-type proton ATPase subunit E [Gammaproteobacteria bacterium]|nr:V-type proton ATPase subunit E [Gammaproteobacteria bacterium]MDH3534515.1 V-type proton ATPase subunit E [Gammaproteobacteria bacterium]